MKNFDPKYTPNHDDHLLRYCYKNQPTIIWWNLVRLAEDIAELFGATNVDDPEFIASGIQSQSEGEALVKRAEAIIESVSEEYKATFLTEYKRVMALKLGLERVDDKDMDELFSPLLDMMESVELDYHHFFRRLSGMAVLGVVSGEEQQLDAMKVFLQKDGTNGGFSAEHAQGKILAWVKTYAERLKADGPVPDEERMRRMKKVNPNFVPRNWVLDGIIKRVEKEGDREILGRVMGMVGRPFEDTWGVNKEEEARWVGDVPRTERAMQCSCSS